MTLNEWEQQLSAHGYRITAARSAVLRVLEASDMPLTPQEVAERGQVYHKELGLVTAYRTLELFGGLGLVERIHRTDGCHGYLLVGPGHRHTLVCRICGRAQVFTGCAALEELIQKLEANTGYRIEDHLLQLFGVCGACQSAALDEGSGQDKEVHHIVVGDQLYETL